VTVYGWYEVGRVRRKAVGDQALRALLDELNRLHWSAGEPSTRQLALGTGGEISHTTVHAALRGDRLPRWRVVELIVTQLCGDLVKTKALWLQAREVEYQQSCGEVRESNVEPPELPSPAPALEDGTDLRPASRPREPEVGRDLLRASVGARPWTSSRPYIASLSAVERNVANGVAEGLTNRQIAARLFLSSHTVNSHLRSIFMKLNIHTRAELAVLVANQSRTSQGG
jgi:DNA-binding CsgD family transcriptional regulator